MKKLFLPAIVVIGLILFMAIMMVSRGRTPLPPTSPEATATPAQSQSVQGAAEVDKEILQLDQEMNSVSANDFNDATLSDKELGL